MHDLYKLQNAEAYKILNINIHNFIIGKIIKTLTDRIDLNVKHTYRQTSKRYIFKQNHKSSVLQMS